MLIKMGVNIPLANSPVHLGLNNAFLPSLYFVSARPHAIIAQKPSQPQNIGGQGLPIKGF